MHPRPRAMPQHQKPPCLLRPHQNPRDVAAALHLNSHFSLCFHSWFSLLVLPFVVADLQIGGSPFCSAGLSWKGFQPALFPPLCCLARPKREACPQRIRTRSFFVPLLRKTQLIHRHFTLRFLSKPFRDAEHNELARPVSGRQA